MTAVKIDTYSKGKDFRGKLLYLALKIFIQILSKNLINQAKIAKYHQLITFAWLILNFRLNLLNLNLPPVSRNGGEY
jgi:hypothetical protein